MPWLSEEAPCSGKLSASRRHRKPIETHPCPQEHWNFQRTAISKKTKKPIPAGLLVTIVANKNSIATTFWRCVAKQKNVIEDQERTAQAALGKGSAPSRALTQLEITPKRLRGNPMATTLINNCTEEPENTGRTPHKKELTVMQQE